MTDSADTHPNSDACSGTDGFVRERLMGLEPERVAHINEAAKFIGNLSGNLVDQVGETLRSPDRSFSVVPEFEFLRHA